MTYIMLSGTGKGRVNFSELSALHRQVRPKNPQNSSLPENAISGTKVALFALIIKLQKVIGGKVLQILCGKYFYFYSTYIWLRIFDTLVLSSRA